VERTPAETENPAPRPLLSRLDQAAAAAVIGLSLLLTGLWWVQNAAQRGRVIDIEQSDAPQQKFALQLNQATWAELSLLPGVGETTARKIVADREANGPFLSVDDLQRISGIGPKTVSRIRPYCGPLPSTVVARSP